MGRKRIDLARNLRQQEVPAEERLWRILRNRALTGFKFRRQHPIGPYFADFACVKTKVIVEADGESHLARNRQDAARTRFLEAAGWLVLRFWNTKIYDDIESVKEMIYQTCTTRLKPPKPPPTV